MSCDRTRTRGLRARVTIASIVSAVVALGVAGSAAAGGALFVSASSGNDANPCSSTQPCRTIGHAVAVASPGSTISVAAGTYAEEVVISKRLTLIGDDSVVDASNHDNGIVISGPGAAGTLVQGFTVENANAEGILAVSTSNVSILQNELMHNDQHRARAIASAVRRPSTDSGRLRRGAAPDGHQLLARDRKQRA